MDQRKAMIVVTITAFIGFLGLKPGDTIVEASSGNTGNAMSMVAAVKGYKMLVVMPNGMSPERTAISQAFGAEVHRMGDFHVNDALAEARRLGEQPGFFAPQQFDNEWNVDENREWLGDVSDFPLIHSDTGLFRYIQHIEHVMGYVSTFSGFFEVTPLGYRPDVYSTNLPRQGRYSNAVGRSSHTNASSGIACHSPWR